jgi:hypothetical protein
MHLTTAVGLDNYYNRYMGTTVKPILAPSEENSRRYGSQNGLLSLQTVATNNSAVPQANKLDCLTLFNKHFQN